MIETGIIIGIAIYTCVILLIVSFLYLFTNVFTNLRIIYHQWRVERLANIINVLKTRGEEINKEDIIYFDGKMMSHIEKIRELRKGG